MRGDLPGVGTRLTPVLLGAFAGVLSVIAYLAVLGMHLPPGVAFGPGSRGLRVLLLAVPLLLVGTFSLRGRLRRWASLFVFLGFMALVLSSLWSSGASDGSLVGGYLPWSDASGYYLDATRFLDGGVLSAFSARRPIFPGLLAALLMLSGRELQIALAVLAGVMGLAVYFGAVGIAGSDGQLAGAMTAFVLLAFGVRFVGTTLTDGLGLSMGALALGALWEGARSRHRLTTLVGIFLLTIALMVRAGAFIVLPALVLWRAWLLGRTARARTGFAAEGVIVVGFGFLLNLMILKGISSPEAVPFSNFSYTLYGLAAGGKGWNQIYIDHPAIASLAEPAQSRLALELALALIRDQPLGLARGALASWVDFISPEWMGMFGFIGGPTLLTLPIIRLSVFGASIAGLTACIANRRSPRYSLLLCALSGVLLSVPFVPPIDADQMRAYAATVPITAALVGVGVALGWKWLSRSRKRGPLETSQNPWHVSATGLVVVGLTSVGVVAVGAMVSSSPVASTGCPPGTESLVVRTVPGTMLDLVPAQPHFRTRVPALRLDDFRDGLDTFASAHPEIAVEFAGLGAGTTIIHTLDLLSGRPLWLMVPTREVPRDEARLGVCGIPSSNELARDYGFEYAVSVELIQAYP